MSDIASQANLSPAVSQLPVSWYFDEKIFELEKRLLFDAGPGYVGHELMVPEPNQFRSLEWLDHSKLLINRDDGFYRMSNICRHRQAVMMQGAGVADRNIVCPVHRWTYNPDGLLIGAPHFPDNPCLNLQREKLERWQGLLFKGPRSPNADLAGMQVAGELDFSGYKLDKVEIHECNYNWKTFIEVYLEDYHVEPFHPGLGKFVSCNDLRWDFGDWYSVQTVGTHMGLAKPGSPTYKRWQEQLMKFRQGRVPEHGAVWLTYYPNIMVEWYPHVLVISTLIPRGPQKTTNIVEFYYPEEIALFERELIEAERAAYMETCIEDDEIALRMDAGRRALFERGTSEVGPYQSPMEDGMQHFHEFLRRELPFEERA